MAIQYLPDEDQLIRYVPWARLRKDENDNVIGVLSATFELRPTEEYLSATWVEFFSKSQAHHVCIWSSIIAIRASAIDVRPKSGFAIGIVGEIKAACLAAKSGSQKIRVIHEPTEDNVAHCALRQWPRENDDLFQLLADNVWNRIVLNRDIST